MTGVTVMRMVEQMDAGPILFQAEEPIGQEETASDLRMRLSEIGAEALLEALVLFEGGVIEELEQDESRATYAPKVDRAMARIDWPVNRSPSATSFEGWTQCRVRGPNLKATRSNFSGRRPTRTSSRRLDRAPSWKPTGTGTAGGGG